MNRIAVVFAAMASAVALAACGSGGSASPLDPASIAPADTPVYVSLMVRPRGATESAMHEVGAKLGVQSIASALQTRLDDLLEKEGLSYDLDVAPWLGQRVLIALVNAPPQLTAVDIDADLTVIGTTDDPAAARDFVTELATNTQGVIGGSVFGHYVAIGEPSAIAALEHRRPGTSLARTAQYKQLIARLGGDPLVAAYVRPRPLARALLATLPTDSAARQALGPEVATLEQIPRKARIELGISVSETAVTLDVVSHGLPSPAGRSLGAGGLSASSWLALALGRTSTGAGSMGALLSRLYEAYEVPLAREFRTPLEKQLLKIAGAVLPALGPLELSISGGSPLTLAAGLTMTPGNPQGTGPLVKLLRSLRLPLTVADTAGRLIATYGTLSARDLLEPSGALRRNAAYRAARAQLPRRSTVNLYMTFPTLTPLVKLLATGPVAAVAEQALGSLRYVIAGGRRGDYRIVVGLN